MGILQALFGKKEEVNYKELINKGAIVLDVRSKEEFAGGHVKGAINIPVDMLSLNIKKLGGKDTYIITCCMSGGRSSMAKSILHAAGYNNVHNGGGWQLLQSKLA
jgi:rhodanese-related sulfurtransferase